MKDRITIDEFGVFLVWVGIILSVISYLASSAFFNALGLVVVIYAIFRSFSTRKDRRALENEAFKKQFLNPIKKSLRGFKRDSIGDKDHKYVSCPSCGQKLRIPKGKGKVKVKCPKCGNKFDARS
mgnify:CR=1 FL=1